MAIYQAQNWKIVKFADKLKDIVCLLIGCTRCQLENHAFKEKELGEEWNCYKVLDNEFSIPRIVSIGTSLDKFYDAELIGLTPRLILQLLGTDCGRNIIHPNCWLNTLFIDYVQGDIEIWKDIKNYEGKYQISNFGRIKGLDRKIVYGNINKGEYHTKKQAILKSTISGKYEMIKLEGNNSLLVHRLVAEHFIQNIENKPYVNHIDQNPLNNFYKNLEWCTQSENIISANRAGNGNIGEKQSGAKLDEEKVLKIKELLKTNIKQKEIAKMFNVGQTTITDIKKGRKWKHVGIKKQPIVPILPKSGSNWIITDVRFPNELEAIKKHNGITIRINRGLIERTGKMIQEPEHISETALDNAKFDYVIENDGTIEELIEQVKKILIKEEII